MNHHPPLEPDNSGLFVIRLRASADGSGLHGRLEHVLSGRWHDFDDARGLLAWLRRERRNADDVSGDRPPVPRPDGCVAPPCPASPGDASPPP